jgi:hypothetical protein
MDNSLLYKGLLAFVLLCEGRSLSAAEDKCPTGMYQSGDYCVAFKSQKDRTIRAAGEDCPVGFYRTGKGYCRAFRNTPQTDVEIGGDHCPSGYETRGSYCIKVRR